MSSELLVELPGKVIKACALPQSTGPHLKLALLVVQADSISVIHGDNGSLYHHYNFSRRGASGAVVDCVYVSEKRTFVVSFENGSLVAFPVDCKDVSAVPHQSWPHKPRQLSCADGSTVVALCEGGYLVAFTLIESGDLPPQPSSWGTSAFASAVTAFHASASHATVVSRGEGQGSSSAAASATKKKKEPSSSNSESLTVSVWEVPSPLQGTAVVISAQPGCSTSVVSQQGEQLVTAVSHSSSAAVSVVTSTRWLKLNSSGDVLFERDLRSVCPVYVTEAGDTLFVLNAERQLHLYDSRYGTLARSIILGDSTAAAPVVASWLAVYPADASKSAVAVASAQLITCKHTGVGGAGSSNLFRRVLALDSAPARGALSTSLCQSIGKLAAQSTNDAAVALPPAKKRQLQEVVSAHQDEAQNGELKRAKLDVAASQAEIAAFLSDLEQRSASAIKAGDILTAESWEWGLVKLLATSGNLSLNRNKSLLSVAAKARRLDVLAAVVESVADLSEKQCVQVLAHVMLMPDSDLANVAVKGGAVVYTEGSATPAADAKKAKKGKSVAVEQSQSGDESLRVTVLRSVVEAVFRRSSAFSTTLLGEAVRVLPLSAAVLLLRVVTQFLRSLTDAVADPASEYLSETVTDEQMHRAATWAEAILDGHFSALALHAVSHPATRRALTCALDTVRSADEAAEQVQVALGLWTHVHRVLRKGGQQVKPITSLYQVEHLDLR